MFCSRVDHVGDIGEANGDAVVIADDQRPVIVGMRDLIVGDDVRGYGAVGDLAAGLCEFCRLRTERTLARVRP